MEIVKTQIVVPPETGRLSEFRSQVYALCQENGVPSQTSRRMVVAMDEAVANVIEHSALDSGDEIVVEFEISGDEIVALIRDYGLPFDPTPVAKTPNHRRFPRRGFGLYLIQLIVDSMEYSRTTTGENLLKLTKAIE